MKKIKSLLKKLNSQGKTTKEDAGRDYLAEQLEPRVLYSGTVAPDVSADDQPVQEAPDNEPEAIGADGAPSTAIEAAQQASAEMQQFVSEGIQIVGGETDIAEDQSVVLLNPEKLGQLGGSGVGVLTQEVAAGVLDAAAERWSVSGVLTDQQADALGDFSVQVADLEGDLLLSVSEDNSTILLDIDAAGREWFVDGSPLDDSEFTDRVSLNGFRADSDAAIAGVDVLTVLMESQGQLLGLDGISTGSDVSATGIEDGLRRIPFADESLTNPDVVTTSLVADLANAAAQRWEKSGLDAAQLEALADIEYRVVDLESGIIGSAEDGVVSIDLDAAGKGWFVDLSPQDDVEFGGEATATSLRSGSGAAAEGIDLLSVIMHEQGHVLGLEHDDSGTVTIMTDVFSEGNRRMITEGEAEGAVPGSLEGVHNAVAENVVSINFTRNAFTGEPDNAAGLELFGASTYSWTNHGFGGGGSTPKSFAAGGATFSFNMDSSGTWNHAPFGSALDLQRHGAWRNVGGTAIPWELTGLDPNEDYDIIFYAKANGTASAFTVDNLGSGSVSVDSDGDTNFEDITSDGSGRISGTWSAATSDELPALQFRLSAQPPQAPIVNDELGLFTDVNAPLNIDVLANDADVNGDTLTVTEVNGTPISVGSSVAVTNGSVELLADKTLEFTPSAEGAVSFTYTVSDGGLTSTGNVGITVSNHDGTPDPFTGTPTLVSINFTRGATPNDADNPNGLKPDDGDGNGLTTWDNHGFGSSGTTPKSFNTAEGQTFTFNADQSGSWGHQPFGSYPEQRQGAWTVTGGTTMPWELTGLTPGLGYDIVFYAQAATNYSSFTVDGVDPVTVDADGDTNFVNMKADVAGTIRGTWTAGLGTALPALQFIEHVQPLTLDAVDDDYTTSNPITEDDTLTIAASGVLANDSPIDAPIVGIQGTGLLTGTSDAGATVTLDPNGSFTYDPTSVTAIQDLNDGDTLTDQFTYAIAGEETALLYDGFDYAAGGIEGQNGGIGFAGAWDAPRNNPVVEPVSKDFGGLVTTGGHLRGPAWANMTRPIGSTLSDAGLMDDGATLWFSVVVDLDGQNLTNADLNFALGTDVFESGDFGNRQNLIDGEAIGFGHNRGRVQGVYWQNNDADTISERNATDSSLVLNNSDNSRALIVGKIDWGNGTTANETLTLYAPGTDLALGSQILSITTPALNQAVFDSVLVQFKDRPQIDEIRFGASYDDVNGPETSTATVSIEVTGVTDLVAAEALDAVDDIYNGAGDISIFTAGAAGESLSGGTDTATPGPDLTHDFETIVRSSDSHVLAANGEDIALSAGHHLVIYNARFDKDPAGLSTEDRSEIQTNLNLAGDDLANGWSQGYIRIQNNQNETVTAGGGIINVENEGDILQLQSFRSDTDENDTVRASDTGIQLLKLDDAWDYLSLAGHDGAGTDQTIPNSTTTWTDVEYSLENELDADAFEYTAGTGITLKEAGHYMIFANTYVRDASSREAILQRLELDGTEVAGSKTSVYLRGNDINQRTDEGAASIGMIFEASAADQVLNVQILQDVGRTGMVIDGDRTGITIVKLPDTADYIQLTDTSNDQNLNATGDLNFDDAGSQVEVDAAFTHSTGTNPSQVTVNSDDDYLFFSSQYDANDGVQRGFYNQRWEVNDDGTPLAYGQTGQYSRNTGGVDEFGNWSGVIQGLNQNDFIATTTQALGNGGTNTADTLALQGVRLGSLFRDVPAVSEDATLAVSADDGVLVNDSGVAGTPAVILATDFAGRTVTGDTAANITWTTNGVADPGDLTAIETQEGDAGNQLNGLFDTANSGDHFAPRLNTDNQDNWSVSIPLVVTAASITIDDVVLDGDHFNGSGNFQTANRDTDFVVSLTGSSSGVVATETKTTGAVQQDWVLTFFDTASPIVLDNSETWTLTIATTNFPNNSGNNTGLDGLTVNGSVINTEIIASDSTSAKGAAVTVNADGSFTYDPTGSDTLQALAAGENTTDTFTYTISDGSKLQYGIDLDPSDARFDSLTDNDDGVGGFAAGDPGTENADGLTFQVTFTPAAGDLDSTTAALNLIEVGGGSNGSGLYLFGGEVYFLSKMNGNANNVPSLINDLDFSSGNNMISAKSSFGPLTAGTQYTVTAIFDPLTNATLDLVVDPLGARPIEDKYTVAGVGTKNNWSGNDTAAAFRGVNLADYGAANNVGSDSFNEDLMNANGFEGTAGRALYWSAHATGAISEATVTPGATLNFDASLDTDRDAVWESTATNQTRNWALGANVTRTTDLSGNPPGITAAYDFQNGTVAADNRATAGTWDTFGSAQQDATFELWIKADDLTRNQVIWETGGSGDGASINLTASGDIQFVVKNGGNSDAITAPLPDSTEFHQIVAVYNRDNPDSTNAGTGDTLSLYIDGVLVAGGPGSGAEGDEETGMHDWAGGDGSALGASSNGEAQLGGSRGDAGNLNYERFDGQIGIMRFYNNAALTDTEIVSNYSAVAGVTDTATVTVTVNGMNDAPEFLTDATFSTTAGVGGISGQVDYDNGGGAFGGSQWHVKNGGPTSGFTRKGYIRMDVSEINAEVDAASLDLQISTIQNGQAMTVSVYGITDESLDSVVLDNSLTWSTAPANDTSSGFAADLTKATLLGTISVPASAVSGDTVSLATDELADFLNTDTDGVITLILGRSSGNTTRNFLPAGESNATLDPPTLRVSYGSVTEGTVTETSDAGAVDADPADATGTLLFGDVDLTDTHTAEVVVTSLTGGTATLTTAQENALLDNLSLVINTDSTGTGAGELEWTYSVPNSEIDFLAAGETVELTHTVAVIDQNALGNGLEAHWSLDSATDGTDLSGNDRDLTLTGVADAVGQIDGALDLNATADRLIATGYQGITGSDPRTLSAWVKTTDNDAIIMSWGENNGSEKWVFRLNNAASDGTVGGLRVELNGSYIVGNMAVNDGQWHHVAMTFDGTAGTGGLFSGSRFYVDGNLDANSTVGYSGSTGDGIVATASGQDVEIGGESTVGSRNFIGQIDDAAIWSRELSSENIALIASGGLGGTAAFQASDTETVTITITGANDVPVANDDPSGTILIDYNDGLDNDIHDAVINDGEFTSTTGAGDPWVSISGGFEFSDSSSPDAPTGSERNFVTTGGRELGLDTGHTIVVGETYDFSYQWIDKFNFDDGSDTVQMSLFFTADDQIGSAAVESIDLNSGLSTSNNTWETVASSGESFSTAAAGRMLFVRLSTTAGTSEFARFDNIYLKANDPDGFITDEDTASQVGDVLANDTDVDTSDSLLITGVDTTGTLGTVTLNDEVLLLDRFTDGGRTDGADALDSDWYRLGAVTSFGVSDDSSGIGSGNALFLDANGANESFVTSFDAVSLTNVGDRLELSFDYRLTADAAGSNSRGLRFGLYDSGGTQNDGDGQAGRTSNDQGYRIDLGVGTGGADVRKEGAGDSILGGSTFGAGLSGTGTFAGFNDTGKHQLTFTLVRVSATEMQITAAVDGTVVRTATDSASLFTTFDEVGISNGGLNTDFAIDNVLLTKGNTTSANFTYDPAGAFEYLARGEVATDTFTYTVTDGVANPDLVTPGATLNYDVSEDVSPTNGTWENTGSQPGFGGSLGDAVLRDPGSLLPGISASYLFDGTNGGDTATLDGLPSRGNGDVTMEMWFRPGDLTGDEVLFESGGTNGIGIYLGGGTNADYASVSDTDLLVTVANSTGKNAAVAYDISELVPGEFIQMATTFDISTDKLSLFINGEFVADNQGGGSPTFSLDNGDITDWTGANQSGIATIGGNAGGGVIGNANGYFGYAGDIATIRVYDGRILTDEEVTNNYQAIASADTATVTVSIIGVNDAPVIGNISTINDTFDDDVVGTNTNGLGTGFIGVSNNVGGSGDLDETGGQLTMGSTGSNNNSGIVSNDPLSVTAGDTLEITWDIESAANFSANGIELLVQETTGFRGGGDHFYLNLRPGGAGNVILDGTQIGSGPFTVADANDGFTVTLVANESGWSWTSTGLGGFTLSGDYGSGNFVDAFNNRLVAATIQGGAAAEMVVNSINAGLQSDTSGEVIEDTAGGGAETDSGKLGFTDVDLTDTHTVTVLFGSTTNPDGQLGDLNATLVTDTTGTGTGGEVTWDYSVDNADIQFLADGETITESYTVVVSDREVLPATEELDASNGTNSIGVTVDADTPLVDATGTALPALITQAYELDGTAGLNRGDFRTDPSGADQQPVTLEFWIKPDVVNQNQVILDTGGSGTGASVLLNADGTVSWLVKEGGAADMVTTTTSLTAGEWVQIAVTYDKNSGGGTSDLMAIYLNGELEDRNDDPGETPPTALNSWSGTDNGGIGVQTGTLGGEGSAFLSGAQADTYGFLDGQVGIVRFYQNQALTEDQVCNNYEALTSYDTETVTVTITGSNDAPVITPTAPVVNDTFDDDVVGTNTIGEGSGFVLVTNPAGNDGILEESGGQATITTSGGNDNSGIVSNDPLTVTATDTVVVKWDIDSAANISANGIELLVQGTTGFRGGGDNFFLRLRPGGAAEVVVDNSTIDNSGSFTLADANDGFTVTLIADADGWSLDTTGLGGFSLSGTDYGTSNFVDVFNGGLVAATVQQGGGTANMVVNSINASVSSVDSPTGEVTETDSPNQTTNGLLVVEDVDVTDEATAEVVSVAVVSGSDNGITNADLLAMMSVGPDPVIANGETKEAAEWTFDSGAETFDYLAEAETLVLDYEIKVTDENLLDGGNFDSAADLANWTVGNDGGGANPVLSGNAFGLAPQSGANYLAFGGNDVTENGFVEQTVNVEVGEDYELSFYWSGRGGVTGSQVTVSETGGQFSSQEYTVASVGDWTKETIRFTAASSTVTVRFQETSGNSRNKGPAIDSVSLVGYDTETVRITVNGTNDVPVATLTGNDIAENGTVTVNGTIVDPDLTDTHTVVIDWQDPNNTTGSTFNLTATGGLVVGNTFVSNEDSAIILTVDSVDLSTGAIGYSVDRQYLDDGLSESTFNSGTPAGNATASDVSAVSVEVTDNNNASGTAGFNLTVANVIPVLTNVNVTPGVINENGTVTVTGNIIDPGTGDAFQLTITWGDGKSDTITLPAGTTSFSQTHVYDSGGNYAINLTLVDDDLGVATATLSVGVRNVPPALDVNGIPDVVVGETSVLSGSFTDPGIVSPHTLVVDWGDGTNSTFVVPATNDLEVGDRVRGNDGSILRVTGVDINTGEVQFEITHDYAEDGIFNVSVSVNDETFTVTAQLTATVFLIGPTDTTPGIFTNQPGENNLVGILSIFRDLGDTGLFVGFHADDAEDDRMLDGIMSEEGTPDFLGDLTLAPFFAGTTNPGATAVILIKDEVGTTVAQTTVIADLAGNWTATFPELELDDGDFTVEVQVTNPVWSAVGGSLESQIATFNGSVLGVAQGFTGLAVGQIIGIVVNSQPLYETLGN